MLFSASAAITRGEADADATRLSGTDGEGRSRFGAAAERCSRKPAASSRGAIPKTGEQLPIVGLGSSATFSQVAGAADSEAIRSVFTAMLENGGTVFDTAPGYGASEEVAAQAVRDLGVARQAFLGDEAQRRRPRRERRSGARQRASRNVVPPHRPRQDRSDPGAQRRRLATQFPILEEYKQAGRVRYIGTTTTFKPQYATLEQFMRDESPDFIGIDYAVDNLDAEERIFPLAQERGIAVLVYLPFGRTRLWERVEGHEVPAWAGEFGATTWAQFFLKFAASHPAVTAVTPATSKPHHMVDNLTAARGRLPDQAERRA